MGAATWAAVVADGFEGIVGQADSVDGAGNSRLKLSVNRMFQSCIKDMVLKQTCRRNGCEELAGCQSRLNARRKAVEASLTYLLKRKEKLTSSSHLV